jgi:predicted secreted protein
VEITEMKTSNMIAQTLAVVALAAAAGSPATADAPLTFDRVTLAYTATRDVDNDTLVAVLYAQREGGDTARLADEVNRAIAHAVERARQVEGVKVQTLDYQTSPVYQQASIVGWRVSQSLRLESQDAARLGKLIGELQKDLAVQSVGYAVSPATRRSAEDGLIGEAVEGFEKRAALVAARLGRNGYRLVSVDVDTSGEGMVPRPMRMQARGMALAADAVPPALEAGTQSLSVTVQGTVELNRP